ncbi:DUF488 family protein [Gulosibacter sp. 10]|uniref:DUF488 domain-containing protein n=1 Tax=Gulosibacter sp. 10 TaxID=1255570 RepID=UPI00097EB705|nr:DUF488 domain-containing protein [Gulosibacter sp. 10]SJM59903.1 hypothetical protein FM112_06860 [Gulosibacter sp. 10]
MPEDASSRAGTDTAPGAGLFTIGHSNHSIEEFIGLLREHSIRSVVDVRKLAGSNRYPQFNADALAESLDREGIRLRRLEALTGRRPVSRTVPFEVNGWWQNRSFHNYADHALSDAFHEDLKVLLGWGAAERCAVMCSEAVWWRCHRRLIADHLLAHGRAVVHVLGQHQANPAELSAGAVIGADARVAYPAEPAS